MRTHQNRRARQSVQLQLPFSWAPTPSNEREKTQAKGGANRQRPANDDCPFSQARGHIPPIGSPTYGRGSANHTKRVEG
jgi:hypothetical protein